MNKVKVIMVRVYIMEGSKLLQPLMHYLHHEAKVRGVSVFRAIRGYGDSGDEHGSSLMDLSLNLPLTIEFFDRPETVKTTLEYLSKILKPEHVVSWEAEANHHEMA